MKRGKGWATTVSSRADRREQEGLPAFSKLPRGLQMTIPLTGESREMLFRQIVQALGRLSPPQRRVFMFSHYEGMSAREIAGGTGCAPPEVSRLLAAANERFLDDLRRHFHFGLMAPRQSPPSEVVAERESLPAESLASPLMVEP